MGLFSRKKTDQSLYLSLEKTRTSLGDKIKALFKRSAFDPKFFEELEEDLILSDVSVDTTLELLGNFRKQLEEKKQKKTLENPLSEFESMVTKLLPENNFDIDEKKLNILFVFGVNGVGKTTSIGKLAYLFKSQGLKVIVAGADTYRAAAGEQLDIWCERAGVPLVKHEGKSKPSAVIYDAVEAAVARGIQVLIVDTAGRLHNRESLMEELKKLNKILSDKAPNALKYNLLVVDANTGQNALQQTKSFNESVGIQGVLISKMDSTAKGGIAITLAHQHNIPVVFMGTGEKIEHLAYFDKETFIKSIFE